MGSAKFLKYIFGLVSLILVLVVTALTNLPDQRLHMVACDIGQGDAILIYYRSTQILVDGGPDQSVLGCLGRYVPFWDRRVEMIVLTNPDKDHYGGLISVVRQYEVENFVSSSLGSSKGFEVLRNEVGGQGIAVVNPKIGQSLRLGLISLDILNGLPAESGNGVLGVADVGDKVNNFSVVMELHFGKFDALLTGDIEPDGASDVVNTGLVSDIEYLKVPHHGSKNGLTRELLEMSRPEIAVISSGKGNNYGHPHKEILDMLLEFGVRTLRTDQLGDIEVVSDGESWWVVE